MKRPDALKLADELITDKISLALTDAADAAELLRLHEVNTDLLTALRAVVDALSGHELNNGDVSALNKAHAAIAKATGGAA